MNFKFLSIYLILLYSSISLARDPFFKDYPTCEVIISTLKKELSHCKWIGMLEDSDLVPILICQDDLVILKNDEIILNNLFSAVFIYISKPEQLDFYFKLPSYCSTSFIYSMKQ